MSLDNFREYDRKYVKYGSGCRIFSQDGTRCFGLTFFAKLKIRTIDPLVNHFYKSDISR